jgi:hypothetical protein
VGKILVYVQRQKSNHKEGSKTVGGLKQGMKQILK